MEIEHPFLITTRPAGKYNPVSGSCFEIVNIAVTEVLISDRIEAIKDGLIQFNPDIIVLTSSTGSGLFLNLGIPLNFKFICIGEKTAFPLREAGINPEVPVEMNSFGLTDYITGHVPKDRRIALCRSEQHDNYLDAYLLERGYIFKDFPLYSLRAVKDDSLLSYIENKNFMGILFTSSMEAETVVNFLSEKNKLDVLDHKSVFSIGKMTSRTLKKYGIQTESMNSESNIEALVKEISEKHCNSGEWI